MKSAKAIIALIVVAAVFIWWRTVQERQFREDVLSAVRKNDTNQLWSLTRGRSLRDKWQDADRSPLSEALDRGHDEAALVLIKAGFPVNITNEHGMTFLMAVCYEGDYELTQALLEAGADVHAKGILGVNSLDSAARSGNEKLVELLLARGADVNITDESGRTPLGHAAKKGKYEAAAVLIKNGAQLSHRDRRGKTPRELAQHGGFTNIVELIDSAQASHEKGKSSE